MTAAVAARLDAHQRLYEEVRATIEWLLGLGTNDFFAELSPALAEAMCQRAARLDTRITDLTPADGE